MCKSYSICILLLILISCTSSEIQTDGQIPVIDIEANINNFKFVNLSELTDDIEYIPLETTKESMLGQIKNLAITEDRFVISGSVYCKTFDKQGNYICDIGSKGHGPGQYISIGTPSFDSKNRKIYLKTENNQILEYTYEGRFIRAIQLKPELSDDFITNSVFVRDGVFCSIITRLSGNRPNIMYLFNETGEVICSFPNNHVYEGFIMDAWLYMGEKILFKDYLSDTIFYFNNDLQLVPYYYMNLGKYRMPMEFITGTKEWFSKNADEFFKKMTEYILMGNFIETNQYVFFNCDLGNHLPQSEAITKTYYQSPGAFSPGGVVEGISRIAGGLYYKENSKVVFLKKHNGFYGLKNDIDGGMPLWPHAQAYKEQLVRVCELTDLKNWINSEEFKASTPLYPERKAEFENMVRNLGDMDNPVLMVVTLRNE